MATEKPVSSQRPDPRWEPSLGASRDRLILLPRNPRSVFVYWEWTAARAALFGKGALVGEVTLRLVREDTRKSELELKFPWDSLHAYLYLPPGGGRYAAMLCVFAPSGAQQTALESNAVSVPRGCPDCGGLPSSLEHTEAGE